MAFRILRDIVEKLSDDAANRSKLTADMLVQNIHRLIYLGSYLIF